MSFSNQRSSPSNNSKTASNMKTSECRSMSRSRIATGLVLLLLAVHNSEAFQGSSSLAFSQRQHPMETAGARNRVIPSSISSSSSPSARKAMTFGDVSEFYQTYPIQSAVLTCGFKASIADCIAQVRAWGDDERAVEMRRNLAYIIYGGIFIGLMSHVEYNMVFPILFGTEQSLQLVLEKVVFDDFISAPLLWLPPAYLIKALLFDYPLQEGLQRYVHDIRNEGLLLKYWSVWVPGQCITFSVIPDHFRVAFMAGISFFWFILFSTVSARNQDQTPEQMLQQSMHVEEPEGEELSQELPAM